MGNREKTLCYAENLFKILLFVYVALGTCNLTYGKSVISYVMYATFFLGALLVLIRVVMFRNYNKMPGLMCAVILWCAYIISCVANIEYFAKSNVVYFVLWTLYLFLLYTQSNTMNIEMIKKEFQAASIVFVVWNSVLVYISLYMLAIGYQSVYRDPNNGDYEIASGLFTGRLWGAYQDPNLGSVMSCAAIVICAYWFIKCKNKALKVFLVVNSILALFYMAMSDSRNGMVCMGVMLAVAFALYWFTKKELSVRNIGIGILVMSALLVCGIMIPKIVQNGYNQMLSLVEDESDEQNVKTIERNYDMSGDITNRRLDVWASGIQIGATRPLTGVSYAGMMPYAEEYCEDTMIVEDETWIFNTFDNELINLFAFNGVIALGIVVIWFALAIKWVFTKFKYVHEEKLPELIAIIVLVCIFITSALFQATMFYQTTPNTVFFWLLFGWLAAGLRLAVKEEMVA